MKKEVFFDVPRTYYTTSYTRTQVPMFFFKVAARFINYFVDYERAREVLKETGVVPVRFFNGKTLVSLVFFDYQAVTIGPYQEVVISIIGHPHSVKQPPLPLATVLLQKRERGWKDIGGYVLEMPVTSPAARAAGREIWGYPKYVTKIPFRLSDKSFEFGVLDPDSNASIVDVKGEMGPGFTAPAFDLVSYTNYEDAIWRTGTEVDGRITNSTCKWIQVKVGPSTHRMAESLRLLGLESAKPFAIMATDSAQTRLNAGKPVAPWKGFTMPYQYQDEIEFMKKMKI